MTDPYDFEDAWCCGEPCEPDGYCGLCSNGGREDRCEECGALPSPEGEHASYCAVLRRQEVPR